MTTPKVGAPELVESQADKEETANEAFRRLEAGSGLFRVEDNDATSPPGSCADGACYIPAATATGTWAGKENYVAIAVGANAANGWYFIAPEEGMRAWVKDEDAEFAYDGSAWSAYSPAAGASSQSKSASFTTMSGVDHYDVDTSGGAVTVTLNASPATNEVVEIWDAGSAGTNAISFDGNGHNIAGSSTLSSFIAVNYGHARLRFNGTQWLIA